MKGKKFTHNWRKKALSMLLVSFSISTVCGLASCKKDKGDDTPQIVPGLGVFYYDTGSDEYQLALNDDYKATFTAKGESKSATYAISEGVLTLTFSDGSQMQAALDTNELTLNYDNGQYRFFKKIYYTVSYDEVGGVEIADTTVVNGQTFAKPADPQKTGHEFLGWYADSEYKVPYSFEQIVTGDVTLYAQWAALNPAMEEYTVDFDLGYETDKLADVKTIAGKIYNVPTPTRTGYKFCGWWVSAYENGEKLTYKYDADTVFKANTTLFALWETENLGSKLSAPEVEVGENIIEWNGVTGVSVYKLKVTGPRGFSTIDEDVSGTSFAVDFANAPAGDYEISVTAVAQSGAANNSETVKRYYKNKAVGRVSKFTILDGSVLLFNRVENATTYYVTVDCGNDLHSHTTYNIGDSTHYNFSACEMQEGGIKFTVTAAAEGYASTTSETFVYNRVLDKVTGLSVDEETQMLSWYPVENATRYVVTVVCGDEEHVHEVVNNGTKTTFSLKECPADAEGKVKISVYAETNGYNSPAATEYVYTKTKLAAPSNVTLTNVEGVYKLSWKKVTGATEYSVKIGNTILTATTNELDITTAVSWIEEASYNVEIKAKNATSESVWSNATVLYYGIMSPNLTYKSGRVYWEPVVGATGYQVQIEGQITTYDDATMTSAPVTFTREGTNEVYVRYKVGNTYPSGWVKLVVENVQAIVFDERGGSDVDTMYKVIGDKLDLPTPTKAGYDFAGWYNTPKGPENNGKLYDETTFEEIAGLMLYAYWTPATYQVTYEVGADGTLSATTGEVTYSQSFKLDVPTVSDGSKVFMGWFAGPDTGAQQLTDDRGNSLKAWNLKQGATIYAQYVTDVLSFNWLENTQTWSVSKGKNIHKVTTVTIPETYKDIPVTVVEGYAFEARTNLVSINIPDTIQIIERETAFYGCSGLREINVYHVDGNNTAVFSSVDGALIKKDEITGQNQLFYYPLAKKGTYVIPDGVTEIPLNLFRGSAVTEVVVPTSVAIIRGNAFRDCAKLEKVTFVEGGTDALSIEDGAFNGCRSLVEITLPSRLESLQLNEETRTLTLFEGCDALSYVNVEKGSATYGSVDGVLTNSAKNKLIYCPAARTGAYTIPRNIIEIGERAFYGCNRLTAIIIPGYVETIGEYAFYGCNRVARVEFSSGAIAGMELVVGDYAFAEMPNLKTVEFKDGSAVAQLGKYAFANATGLRSFTVPATMSKIDDYAFDNATALANVIFEENGVELTFGNYVFNECTALTRVDLPASVTKLNLGVFDGCVNISEIKVATANQYYKDIDGIVFSKDGKDLLFFPKGRRPVDETTGEYVIPTGVESISDGAFKGMRYITKIVINNTITHIGKGAFANSLELATLEFATGNDTASLTIGESAFEDCAKIQTLVLPTRAKVVEAKAFYHVSISSITFPAGLTTIGDYAFASSGITTVEIPAGLETLGTNVFDSCVNLKTVTFATGFNATEIPMGTFQKSGLTSIEIPASIEKIGYTAFNSCVSLETVTFAAGTADLIIGYMPEGMDTGSSSGGKEDEKDKGQSSVISGVFSGCTKLKTITIPDRAVYIGNYAFSGCTNLATVTINETSNLQRIADGAFASTGLSSIYIPKTVQNTPYVNEQTAQEIGIGKEAFAGVPLTSITFGMGGTGELSIGELAFSSATIKAVTLPKRIAPIYTADRHGMFYTMEGVSSSTFNSSSITDINIEDEGGDYYGSKDGVLYRVTDGALSELMYVPKQKTGSITVPKTVTLLANSCANGSLVSEIVWEDATNVNGLPLTIGNSALANMKNLTSVTFPERTVAIGSTPFFTGNTPNANVALQTVHFPKNLETLGNRTFYMISTITTVTFADGCKLKEIPQDMFCTANASNVYGNLLTAIRIPANVEKIGQYAFRGCTLLTDFKFEDGSKLKTITGSIFSGMPLKSLDLPDGLVNLDGAVFSGMSQLETLELPAALTQISTAVVSGGSVNSAFLFDNCPSLKSVTVPSTSLHFADVDGVVYTKDLKTIIYYPRAKAVGTEILDEDDQPTGTYDGVFVTPAGVQTIGTYAFKSNANIKELVVSADLLFIQREAFASSYVKKLTFNPRTSTLSLGDSAFSGCWQLGNNGADTLTIPETVEISGQNVFAATRYGKVHFEEGNTTTALNQTFYNCNYLTEVTGLPEFLTSMTQTFTGNSSGWSSKLTKVEFVPGAYVEAMRGTFYNCKNLQSITIPSVGSLLDNASQGTFENCTSLTTVTIAELGYIGKETFMNCTSLQSFVMPDTVSQMGENVFNGCTSLQNITLSTGLETIPYRTFYNCSKLASIEIGGYVTTIGNEAFKGCTALTSVTLPDGLVSIGNNAFEGAKLVQTLVLPEGLQTIGNSAFKNWAALKAITIPASVVSIGASAFSGCVNVETITLPEGAALESLGDYAFENISKVKEFFIPATLTDLGIGVFAGWGGLDSITVEGGNTEFAYDNGILYNATYTQMIFVTPKVKGVLTIPETITSLARSVFAGLQITDVVLPDTITEIPDNAFRGCTLLETVQMPKYLERIGVAAFEGCTSLKNVTIPASVRSTFVKNTTAGKEPGSIMGYYTTELADGIGKYAFANCTALETVTFEAGGTQRLSFGDYAFYNCKKLSAISIPNRVRTQAIISYNTEGVSSYLEEGNHDNFVQGIGRYCFAMCKNLKTVVFEETGVATFADGLIIRLGAFTGCTSLESVTLSTAIRDYEESIEQRLGKPETYTIQAIEGRVFDGCTNLTVTFPAASDYQVTVRATAFEDFKVEFPKYVTVDTQAAGDYYCSDEAKLFLYGCTTCCAYNSPCDEHNPVADGVMESKDVLYNVKVTDTDPTRLDNGKPITYTFNGMLNDYCSNPMMYMVHDSYSWSFRYAYTYEIVSYNEQTGIVTLKLTGVKYGSISNPDNGKKFNATVDLKNGTFTLGSQI